MASECFQEKVLGTAVPFILPLKSTAKEIAGDKGLEKLAVVPCPAVGNDSSLEQSLRGSTESPWPPGINVKRQARTSTGGGT